MKLIDVRNGKGLSQNVIYDMPIEVYENQELVCVSNPFSTTLVLQKGEYSAKEVTMELPPNLNPEFIGYIDVHTRTTLVQTSVIDLSVAEQGNKFVLKVRVGYRNVSEQVTDMVVNTILNIGIVTGTKTYHLDATYTPGSCVQTPNVKVTHAYDKNQSGYPEYLLVENKSSNTINVSFVGENMTYQLNEGGSTEIWLEKVTKYLKISDTSFVGIPYEFIKVARKNR